MGQLAEGYDGAIREGIRKGAKTGAENEAQHRVQAAPGADKINSLPDG
jgi:hypothetical protein